MGMRHGAQRLRVPGAAWLTLRRRPWTPRLASWIAVGMSATTAGMLLGIAADKMYYESYGVGGWLQWGALLAAGDRFADAVRQRADVGTAAADLPRTARARATAGPARR